MKKLLLLGTTFSNQSDLVSHNSGFYEKTISLAGGFALTQQFSSRLSLDMDLQYQHVLSRNLSLSKDVFLDTDLGYYVYHHKLQLTGGLSFNHNNFKINDHKAYRLTFNPGLTIETGKSYIIVIYLPIDLLGREVERAYGFSLAFTLGFD